LHSEQKPAHSILSTETPVFIDVGKNEPVTSVATKLNQSGLVHSEDLFLEWMQRLGMDRHMQYGRFKISPGTSLWHVIHTLCRNQVMRVTIPEGLSRLQLSEHLSYYGFNPQKILNLIEDPVFIRANGLNEPTLEGYLFPDTYHLSYGMPEETLLQNMVLRFFQVTRDIQLDRSALYKRMGLRGGLIIASIIEKESRYLPERPKIASVFWNRLQKDWRLDSDVTVHYALGDWKKILTREDLKLDSPYNTRKYKGLPPGAICNPGKSSLEAAFFPEETDYLFFIASGAADGHSIFTRDLKEHQSVKRKIRKSGGAS
jgi:UPF0755 protein